MNVHDRNHPVRSIFVEMDLTQEGRSREGDRNAGEAHHLTLTLLARQRNASIVPLERLTVYYAGHAIIYAPTPLILAGKIQVYMMTSLRQ
jgi:hypothetical protein